MFHSFPIFGIPAAMLLVILYIHGLRSWICARIFTEEQFERFQREGLASHAYRGWLFEHRYMNEVLGASRIPASKGLLRQWRICTGLLLALMVLFLACSLALPLVGR